MRVRRRRGPRRPRRRRRIASVSTPARSASTSDTSTRAARRCSVPDGAGAVAAVRPAPTRARRAAPPPRRPRLPPATPAAAPAKACQKDDDCPRGNICAANVCQQPEPSTNIFPIYYSEGSFREIMLLWWQRKGTTGYTVFAPFYWHFYSPTSDFLGVAPFYWRSEDRARQLPADRHSARLVEQRAGRAGRSRSGRSSTGRRSTAGRCRCWARSSIADPDAGTVVRRRALPLLVAARARQGVRPRLPAVRVEALERRARSPTRCR